MAMSPNSSSIGAGMGAFAASLVLSLWIAGPQTCADGWRSPSIGVQGACSWHGGVNSTPQVLAFLVSAVIGWIVYKLTETQAEKAFGERTREVERQLFPDSSAMTSHYLLRFLHRLQTLYPLVPETRSRLGIS
jgi:hypothetical protein